MKTAKSCDYASGFVTLFFLGGGETALALLAFSVAMERVDYWILIVSFVLIGLYSVGLVCSFFRTFLLTEEGIVHKLFGVRYRMTPWSDIRDISRVCMAPKRGLEILVIRKCAEILRPRTRGLDKGLVVGSIRTQMIPTMTGKMFVLRDTPEILECIRLYYGDLDFDDRK